MHVGVRRFALPGVCFYEGFAGTVKREPSDGATEDRPGAVHSYLKKAATVAPPDITAQ